MKSVKELEAAIRRCVERGECTAKAAAKILSALPRMAPARRAPYLEFVLRAIRDHNRIEWYAEQQSRGQSREASRRPRRNPVTQMLIEIRDALRKRGLRGTGGEVFAALKLRYPHEETRDGAEVVHVPSGKRGGTVALTAKRVADRLSRANPRK